MIITTKLKREFLFNYKEQELILSDPSPNFSVDMVLNFYAPTYPILTTAKVEGPDIVDDTLQYRFTSMFGTKG